jgi:nucleosome binding factor SPN SPT16 subunit
MLMSWSLRQSMRVEEMEKRRRMKKKRQSHQRKRVTKKRREEMKMRMKILQISPSSQGAPPEQHKLINYKNILNLVIAITNLRARSHQAGDNSIIR